MEKKVNKTETRREAKKFLNEVKEAIRKSKEIDNEKIDPKGKAAEDFIFGLAKHLSQHTSKYIACHAYDLEKGLGEAIVLGVASFVCLFLDAMQAGGAIREGVDNYTLFVEGILPAVHESSLSTYKN